MAVINGSVALNSSTPTAICVMGESGALVYHTATTLTVVVGGPNVTTATGIPLPTSQYVAIPGARVRASVQVPSGSDDSATLYGICTTGTPSINFLAPQGG